MAERLTLYDTTLRDGQQTAGVDFSVADKTRIAAALDTLGVDYIEGGWPGANPTDDAFFAAPPKLSARFTAFGMTRRAGRSAQNDDVLAGVLNANTQAVCLVGKTHPFHVEAALGISRDENLAAIHDSIAHIVASGREALFDAEHFFDGHSADPAYALDCLRTALDAGARWCVLCDTNGGTLPLQIGRQVEAALAAVPGDRLGIHTHNDLETAVAGSLAAIDAGARQVQGTLNGLGERCGNANLTALIPTLLLKAPYRDQFTTGITGLDEITRISRMLDDILNRKPNAARAYTGTAAFTHKAGLHASAILKDPTTYEHVPPETVGNARVIPMSNQAGQSNLRRVLSEAGVTVARDDPRLPQILSRIKTLEDEGYAFDGAPASFELLAREALGLLPRFFEVERYRVMVEKRRNAMGEQITLSEAVVVLRIGSARMMSVSESRDREADADQGPVNALWRAMVKDLGPYQDAIGDIDLVDYKVRIINGGTEAVTRVQIESQDSTGRSWVTVGVSANIVDASFQALRDAMLWKLVRDEVRPQG